VTSSRSHSNAIGDSEAISAPARVVRVESSPEGIIVGLEFVE